MLSGRYRFRQKRTLTNPVGQSRWALRRCLPPGARGLRLAPHVREVGRLPPFAALWTPLRADRIRHGIRAVDDAALVRELADRGTVLDVCLVSNLCTGAVGSLTEHPVLRLTAEGVRCSLSTDDPATFDTDLDREYSIDATLGVQPRCSSMPGCRRALRRGDAVTPSGDRRVLRLGCPQDVRAGGRSRSVRLTSANATG